MSNENTMPFYETANNIVYTQNLNGILGQGLNKFIEDLKNNSYDTDDFNRGVKTLIQALGGDVVNLQYSEVEKMGLTPMNLQPQRISYQKLDLSKDKVYQNAPFGSTISGGSSAQFGSYIYNTKYLHKPFTPSIQDITRYSAQLQNGKTEYFNQVQGNLMLTLNRMQMVETLKALTSKPSAGSFNVTENNESIYTFDNENIFSKFNHQSEFMAGEGEWNDMIVYVDSSLKKAEAPKDIPNVLSKDKIKNILRRMNLFLQTGKKSEIFIFLPVDIYDVVLDQRRAEIGANPYTTHGIKNDKYFQKYSDISILDGIVSVEQDILYNGTDGRADIKYVIISTNLWVEAFGSAKRTTYKAGNTTSQVYTIFAMTKGVLKYESSPVMTRIETPVAPMGSSYAGIVETMQKSFKYSNVVQNPYGLIAVEVLADDIDLSSELPLVNLNSQLIK